MKRRLLVELSWGAAVLLFLVLIAFAGSGCSPSPNVLFPELSNRTKRDVALHDWNERTVIYAELKHTVAD